MNIYGTNYKRTIYESWLITWHKGKIHAACIRFVCLSLSHPVTNLEPLRALCLSHTHNTKINHISIFTHLCSHCRQHSEKVWNISIFKHAFQLLILKRPIFRDSIVCKWKRTKLLSTYPYHSLIFHSWRTMFCYTFNTNEYHDSKLAFHSDLTKGLSFQYIRLIFGIWKNFCSLDTIERNCRRHHHNSQSLSLLWFSINFWTYIN